MMNFDQHLSIEKDRAKNNLNTEDKMMKRSNAVRHLNLQLNAPKKLPKDNNTSINRSTNEKTKDKSGNNLNAKASSPLSSYIKESKRIIKTYKKYACTKPTNLDSTGEKKKRDMIELNRGIEGRKITQDSSFNIRMKASEKWTEGSEDEQFKKPSVFTVFDKMHKKEKTLEVGFFSDESEENEDEGKGGYRNILEDGDEDDDEPFGAKEHMTMNIMNEMVLDLDYLKERWEDVLFILGLKYNACCFMNNFEKILSLYHFVTTNLMELSSMPFKPLLENHKTDIQSRNWAKESRDQSKTQGSSIKSNMKIHQNIAKNITNPTKLITQLQNYESHNLHGGVTAQKYRFRVKEEHLYMMKRSLYFLFKSMEEQTSQVDFETVTKNLESVIIYCIRLEKGIACNVVQAFHRLFFQLHKGNTAFMMETEMFCKLAHTYLTTLNAVLDHNIRHYIAKKEGERSKEAPELIDLLGNDDLSLSDTLDNILRMQHVRIFLLENFPLSIVKHFELLKETIILVPSSSLDVLSSMLSSIFIFCKHTGLFSLLKRRLSLKYSPIQVFQSLTAHLLDCLSSPGLFSLPTHCQAEFASALTSLKKHTEGAHNYSLQAHIPLDHSTIKDMILIVHKTSFRLDHPACYSICKSIVDTIGTFVENSVLSFGEESRPAVASRFLYVAHHMTRFASELDRPAYSDLRTSMKWVIQVVKRHA